MSLLLIHSSQILSVYDINVLVLATLKLEVEKNYTAFTHPHSFFLVVSEEAAVLAAAAKHNGSPISSTSPRAATPKRVPPPPLVYSSHSASLTSPPVVTIAPTQSLSLANDGRQVITM